MKRYDACNFLTNRCASVTEVSVIMNLAVKEKVLGGLNHVNDRGVL